MTACVGLVSCKYSPYSSIMGETHCFLGNDYQVSSFSGFRGKMQKVAVSWIHVLQCFWRIVSLGPPWPLIKCDPDSQHLISQLHCKSAESWFHALFWHPGFLQRKWCVNTCWVSGQCLYTSSALEQLRKWPSPETGKVCFLSHWVDERLWGASGISDLHPWYAWWNPTLRYGWNPTSQPCRNNTFCNAASRGLAFDKLLGCALKVECHYLSLESWPSPLSFKKIFYK